jgi:hypothetical protein
MTWEGVGVFATRREDDEEGARRALREDDGKEATHAASSPSSVMTALVASSPSSVMTALVAVIHALGTAPPLEQRSWILATSARMTGRRKRRALVSVRHRRTC